MTLKFDTTTDTGAKALHLLETEEFIWLDVVNSKNEPTPTLVWFLLEEDTVLIFSEPTVGKVKSIRRNSNVALHFNSNETGTTMIVLNGTAELLTATSAETITDRYLTKYAEGMKTLDMNADQMVGQYSQPIRITIDRVRGY